MCLIAERINLNQMHGWISKRYYANRARRGRVATDSEIRDRERLFTSEVAPSGKHRFVVNEYSESAQGQTG
jgi:hypothetical protein